MIIVDPSKPLSLSTGTSSPGGPSNPIGGSPPSPSGGTSSGSSGEEVVGVQAALEAAGLAALAAALVLAQIQILGHTTITKPTYHIDRK